MGRRKKKDADAGRLLINFVQDKSGSMFVRTAETISGYNEFIEDQQRNTTADTLVTLVQFDTSVDSVYTAVPLKSVEKLTDKTYRIGGATALLDAVGAAIKAAENRARKDDRVLTVIQTDGQENSSIEFDYPTITRLLESKRKDGWEFVFLGAGEDSWSGAAKLGINKNHALFYGSGAHSHAVAHRSLSAATTSYSNSGERQVANYFKSESDTLGEVSKDKGTQKKG